ncbi:transglycosylase SLT domain-containing protein [Pasteurella canis]|uniref:transglycosylase SLT domain-containing protein n=1 Tax=Pasteurella canis TaxID=753 RepID=UPI00132A9127|nr:transglycosylase SLT domain-containing protein [Pasteurella canis]MXN87998.1 transglycosylase SLT domain-containing protein [Pasteurella canis]
MKFYVLTLSFLFSLLSVSTWAETQTPQHLDQIKENTLLEQYSQIVSQQQKARQTYQKIQQLLSRSQSDATLAVVNELLRRIEDYSLYPYAQYQYLNATQDKLTLEQIDAYQKQYSMLPFATELKKQWLQQAQIKSDWQSIVDNAIKLPQDIASRCIILQAEYETLPKSTALSIENWQKKVTQLWLTGASLPKQCDPVLTTWIEKGYLSDEELKTRAVLAFEQKNQGLLVHLQQQAKDRELKQWLIALTQLTQVPQLLQNPSTVFYPLNISAQDTLAKRIVLNHFPNFIKTLKESTIQDNQNPFSPYEIWANGLELNLSQKNQWKKHLMSHLFDSDNSSIQEWRDKTLIELRDDTLTERRIRTAIREKTDITPWLALLSDTAKNKEEWRYWQAKVLTTDKNTQAQAKKILISLTQQRGFYPMLASAELGIEYQPKMQTFTPNPKQKIQAAFHETLNRIAELRWFNDLVNMNLEWKRLLEQASFEQKLALAHYADTQEWFDLAVEATIQAKAWGHIALRLPNAYLDWFDLHLKNKNIDRTFAMAIARQESAWKHNVSSHANARGLMQLLPTTAKQTAQKSELPYFHENQLFDPFDNIMLGTAHLQELYEKYGNNRILIAAAYNAGVSRVDRWLAKANSQLTMAEFIASIPFYETRGYVQNVLTYDLYYQILQQHSQQKFSTEEYNRLY